MKNLFILIALTLIFFTSCEKEEKTFHEDNIISDDIEKIETIYKEGDIKNENVFNGYKIETSANSSLKEKIR